MESANGYFIVPLGIILYLNDCELNDYLNQSKKPLLKGKASLIVY